MRFVLVAFLAMTQVVWAQPLECCECAEGCPRRPQPTQEGITLFVASLVFFGVGAGIQLIHAAVTHSGAERAMEIVPIAGPITVVARGHLTPDWTAALVFASCAEIAGLLALGFAVPMLFKPDAPVRVGGGFSSTGMSLGVTTRF